MLFLQGFNLLFKAQYNRKFMWLQYGLQIAFLVILHHLQATLQNSNIQVRFCPGFRDYIKERFRIAFTENGKREIRVYVFLKIEYMDEYSTTQFWPLIL